MHIRVVPEEIPPIIALIQDKVAKKCQEKKETSPKEKTPPVSS